MALTSVAPRFARTLCPARKRHDLADRKNHGRWRNRPATPIVTSLSGAAPTRTRDNGARGRAGEATPPRSLPAGRVPRARSCVFTADGCFIPPRIPTIFNPTEVSPHAIRSLIPSHLFSSGGDKRGSVITVSVALVHHRATRNGKRWHIDRNRHLQSRCLAVLRTRTGIVSRSVVSTTLTAGSRLVNETHRITPRHQHRRAQQHRGSRHGDIPNGAVQELNRASSRCGSSTANGIRWRCSNGFCRPFRWPRFTSCEICTSATGEI